MKTEIETKHTPYVVTEKWNGDTTLHGELPVVRFSGCDAIVSSLGAPKFECERIAHMIAAAPALLEALSYTNLDTDHEGQFCNCPLADGTRPDKHHATSCLAARAAISKAKGAR